MRNFFALIIVLLVTLCLFSCADNDAGDTPDVRETTESVVTTVPDETDEPDTKVDYLTSVDEEVNGFSVKGQKYYYEYNDEDFLIFDVENLTEKVQTVKISVTFYDENGSEVEKGTESFPDFPVEGVHSFIFRTSEKFAGFTYEISAKEYGKEPVFGELNFDINGLRRIDITDTVTGNKVPSLCADFACGMNENDFVSYASYMCNVVVFDTEGNVQSLSTISQSVGSREIENAIFLRKIPEDYDMPLDELNAKVILSDINYRYVNEGNQNGLSDNIASEKTNGISDSTIKIYDTENIFDNGFSVKEKKYTLDGKDFLLFSVENPTDISYGITITVKYFDSMGALIKKQVQSYDWFCENYQKYFLFRPGKTFDSYTYEVDFVKTEEEVPCLLSRTDNISSSGYPISENEEMIYLPAPILTKHIENKSNYDIMYIYCYMIFDDKGELYDIIRAGMISTCRANSNYESRENIYYFNEEDSGFSISLEVAAEKFDGQAKAIMIIMDAEIIENYDEIYG